MTLAKIIPMAFVMIAGPQIISAVMFATSEKARANSVAYVAGAMFSTVAGTVLLYFVAEALGPEDARKSSSTFLEWIFIVLLSILAVRVYLKRKEKEPPTWMGKLQTASPGFALKLGLLLFVAMPTDVLTMLTVGGFLSGHNESLLNAIPFWLLVALLVGLPLLVLLIMGERAQTKLPKLRDWMSDNAWVVSEIVIAFFLIMELKDALLD